MKKAVIATGAKQYLVSEGQTIEIELLKGDAKTVTFTPLLIIDNDKTEVGRPELSNGKVTAEVIERERKDDKVTSLRYKAKKRVHRVKGHRQRQTKILVKTISTK